MEKFEFFLAFGILFLLLIGFIKIALRIRKTGGTMSTTVHGALDAFYDKDKKKSVEMVVEKQAHKKMGEQSSDEHNNE